VTLLGRASPVPERYAPEVLDPIPRARGREALGLVVAPPGEDVWHGWELSWLDPAGRPRTGVGRFAFPADTENLVESKSFKLYLNSINQETFESDEAVAGTLASDLSAAAGGAVEVEVLPLDSPLLAPTPIPGDCVDEAEITGRADQPEASLLRVARAPGETQVLHSHALRSLCPVTAQPDWATVVFSCEDARLEPGSLLAYLLGFRQHQDFHEQCVERIFRDLQAAGLETFSVQALYTRRGGLDINPWRSTRPGRAPRLRALRQ
jgi:7-cyano-7-deazaguanine reductase